MTPPEKRPPRAGTRLVTSLQNETVKLVRALEMRKVRRETGSFVAEGTSVLLMARDHGWLPRTLIYRAGAAQSGITGQLATWAAAGGADVLEVSQAVLGKIAFKDNPQSLLGIFAQRWHALPGPAAVRGDQVWLALEAIRDPGNLGTIVRTADAVGAAGVILVGRCCDPYSREGVRATMGSIFSVPLARADRDDFLAWRRGWRGDVIGTHLAAK
jgi:TrmH family RNA methyltransferase